MSKLQPLDLAEVFSRISETEYGDFDQVPNKLHPRPDMCAFLLLDKLVPPRPGLDMVFAVGHDTIYLNVDIAKLAKVATEDDILTLSRCGVRYGETGLEMFV